MIKMIFYNKKTKIIAVGTVLAAIVNIVLNYIMITWFGAMGAVVATAIAHGTQFLFHMFFAKKIKEEKFPFRFGDFIIPIIAWIASVFTFLYCIR